MATKANSAPLVPQTPTGGDEAVIAAQAALDNPSPAHPTPGDPEGDAPIFVIGEHPRKHLFRSIPGVLHDAKLRIDVKEDWWEDPQDDPKSHMSRGNARVFLQGWKRRNSTERQQLIEDALMDNGGDPEIKFIKAPTPGRSDGSGIADNTKIEVYFATDSDAIATLIREAIDQQKGDFRFIYEVDQSTHLKVGDKRFARTTVGLRMANQYMAEIGATTIEVEERAS